MNFERKYTIWKIIKIWHVICNTLMSFNFKKEKCYLKNDKKWSCIAYLINYFKLDYEKNNCTDQSKSELLLVYNHPDCIFLLKVNNRNTRARCEICSKWTIKTPKRHQKLTFLTPWYAYVFISSEVIRKPMKAYSFFKRTSSGGFCIFTNSK